MAKIRKKKGHLRDKIEKNMNTKNRNIFIGDIV